MKKKIIVIIIILIFVASVYAAEVKWSAMATKSNASSDDLTLIVDDPGGTPTSYAITRDNFIKSWTGDVNIATVGTIGTGTWNGTAIDISDYTNLAVVDLLSLSDDTIDANTAAIVEDDAKHLATNEQIYDFVIGLGYITADPNTHDAVTYDTNMAIIFSLTNQVIEVNIATPTNGRDDALSTSDDIYDWGVAAFQVLDANLTAIAAITYGSKGNLRNTGEGAWDIDANSYSLSNHDHSGTYEPADANLTAIAALTYDSTGFLRNTGEGTWDIDANSYQLSDANLTTLSAPTAWRLFYSDGDSIIQQLALGTDGQYLKSNGATSAPTFDTPGGSGDMLKSTYDVAEDGYVDGNDTAYDATSWNGNINAPSMNAVYDYLHQIDSDDDGSLVDESWWTTWKLDDWASPDDNTDLNVSTSAHGLMVKLPNDSTKVFDGSGSWVDVEDLSDEIAAGIAEGELNNSIIVSDDIKDGEVDVSDDTNLTVVDLLKLTDDSIDANTAAVVEDDAKHLATNEQIYDWGVAAFQPLESTLTDIADGTIAENLVNTDNPWADDEVADDITASSYLDLSTYDNAEDGFVDGNDTAYNATSWNGNINAPSMNAVRDKIEALPGGHDAVTLDTNMATIYTLTSQAIEVNIVSPTDGRDDAISTSDDVYDFVIGLGYITATLTEEEVEDFVGGMLGGTETHISVTYQDDTGDIDFVVSPSSVAGAIGAGEYADNTINNADLNWSDITYLSDTGKLVVGDNESTNENNLIAFIADANGAGNEILETDGDFHYNPSTGTVTATEFVGGGAGLTAVDAATGDSATDFFDAGEIADDRISNTLTSSTCTGNAATVTTNANLTGEVTSVGNAATIADSVTVTGWVLGTSSATQITSPTLITDLIDTTGAADMDYGSGDVTDHTFIADGGTAVIDGSFQFPDADGSPSVVGEFQYDNTVTGIKDGTLVWYDDDEVRYLVDVNVLPSDDDFVVSYDADNDMFYMKTDADSGGATAWDDITNPDAADTIDFGVHITQLDVNDFRIGDVGAGYMKIAKHAVSFVGTGDIDLPNDSVDDADINWGDLTDLAAGGVLSGDCVDENHIADNGIDSEHYNDDSIDNAHINWADIDNLGDEGAVTLAATVTVADDEDTDDDQEIVFTTDNATLESDGDFHYSPDTGTVTATEFSGGGASLTAVDAATGDSATDFFDAGEIADDRISDTLTSSTCTGNAATVTTNANLTGDVTSTGNATDITESVLAVGGTDTVFPADPGADKYLMWDDDPGELVWSAVAGAGDMTKAVYDVAENSFVDGNDTVYSSAMNGNIDAPSSNIIYDYLHQIDTDDDGDADNIQDLFIKLVGDTTGAMSEDLNLDDGTFVVDYDSNRIGIGTATPNDPLTVKADANNNTIRLIETDGDEYVDIRIAANGNFEIYRDGGQIAFSIDDYTGRIGIGTDTPDALLHIQQPDTTYSFLKLKTDATWLGLSPSADDGLLWGTNIAGGVSNGNTIFTSFDNLSSDHDHEAVETDPAIYLHSATDPDTANTEWGKFIFKGTGAGGGYLEISTGVGDIALAPIGSVGIGTTSPDTKLQVVGALKVGDDNTNYFSAGTTGDVSFTGSASFSPPSGTDPDVDASGEISIDTDGANEPNDVILRTADTGGDTQYVLARSIKMYSFHIENPDELETGSGRADKWVKVGSPKGVSFKITKIEAWSDSDNYDFELYETNGRTDFSQANDSLIDTIECDANGTGIYTDQETSGFDDAIIDADDCILFVHKAGTTSKVSVDIWGYENANVD